MSVNVMRLKSVAKIVIPFVIAVVFLHSLNIRLNFTSSHVPAGIWQGVGGSEYEIGDTVTFALDDLFALYPERRNEHAVVWSGSLMKTVAAFEGAVIDRDERGITVDGRLYANAVIRPPYEDGSDPCKVSYPHVVEPGHVWLMADTREAYDSRYFGDVPISMLWERVRPIWLW